MPALTCSLPAWADVNEWEEDVELFHQDEATGFAATLWTLNPMRPNIDIHHFRLFHDEKWVAAVKVMGPGNIDVPTGNVLCFVEVRPGHRGQRHSKTLMGLVQERLGVVYRTGNFSVSGFANSKNLDLPLVPGHTVHVSARAEYQFVDWASGSFDRR